MKQEKDGRHILSTTAGPVSLCPLMTSASILDGKIYLSVVGFARTEQSLERIVAGDDKAGKIHEELAGDVEEYEEEVDTSDTKECIDLGDRRLLLQIIERWILGQLWRP